MRVFVRVLAAICIVATLAMAAVVWFGWQHLTPEIVSLQVQAVKADANPELFEQLAGGWREATLAVDSFAEPRALEKGDCSLVTCTVRLDNRGFFPCEWPSLRLSPGEGDLFALLEERAGMLAAGSQGDLVLVFLHEGPLPKQWKVIVQGYVLGQKFEREAEGSPEEVL